MNYSSLKFRYNINNLYSKPSIALVNTVTKRQTLNVTVACGCFPGPNPEKYRYDAA